MEIIYSDFMHSHWLKLHDLQHTIIIVQSLYSEILFEICSRHLLS